MILSCTRRVLAPLLAPLACMLALVACGGNQPEPTSPSSSAPSSSAPAASTAAAGGTTAAKGPVKEPGEAKVGDTTKCPVSGEEFTVEASSPKVEYEGKTYYFCCGGCKKKFEADPAKFAKKS
ncbi:Lead, cadmium, zinc and mercury transporting ATPase [Labilithrix luteola]|uniref:Lead, cadmium, zinc and mercury transporting ATPase n=1 Tax=Labilithrix luteola TaxID=1391654 RepID=A0A0K1PW27_9BACT|nr:YHS domain-containing protein [Labilithrix luteola]AKU97720.1 Lead, cadmium, zinc and mercury transporting ATPase [Labilithrix luteola]